MAGVNRPLTRRSGPWLNYLESISLVLVEAPTTRVVAATSPVLVNDRVVVTLTLSGSYSVLASGTDSILSGANASLPALTLEAYSGATLQAAIPALTASISGTVTAVGRVDAALPALTLVANGKTGGVSTAYLQHGGAYSVDANTGAQLVAGLAPNGYALTSSGKTGGIAEVDATLTGMYSLEAGIVAEAYARVDATLPSLQTAPSGQAWLVGPRMSLHAVGTEVVAATYEAYAINLTTGAVTHYTNYPFDNILRFGDKFYGASSSGLFEIGGSLDLTLPIEAHVKTFQTTLGSMNKKRIPTVYSSGRSDGGVTIGVTADEGTTYEYTSDWGEVPGNTNHRTVPGKGINGVYYSLDVKNVNGGSLELDTISVEVAHTTRAI